MIFGIVRVIQTIENTKNWLPQPNQIRDTSIPVIGGVSRRRADEAVDVHSHGHIFDYDIYSRFNETQPICALEVRE